MAVADGAMHPRMLSCLVVGIGFNSWEGAISVNTESIDIFDRLFSIVDVPDNLLLTDLVLFIRLFKNF